MLLLPPVRVDGLVSVEIELLSSLTDWHTGLVPQSAVVLGVVAATVGRGTRDDDFELEPQPANANAASASVAVAIERTSRPEHRLSPVNGTCRDHEQRVADGRRAGQADTSLWIASSSSIAMPSAVAIALAADTTFGVPMIGATAINAPRTSSAVRPVLAAAARFSKYEPGGAFTAAQRGEPDHHQVAVTQAGTFDRVRRHLQHGVQ